MRESSSWVKIAALLTHPVIVQRSYSTWSQELKPTLLKYTPPGNRGFDQRCSFFAALLGRTPDGEATTGCDSLHKNGSNYLEVVLHLRGEEQRSMRILHIKVLTPLGIPATYILLGMRNSIMQALREIKLYCSKREAVKMGMKDGLAEDAMFPEDNRSIVLAQKLLHFAFQCE